LTQVQRHLLLTVAWDFSGKQAAVAFCPPVVAAIAPW